MRGAAAGAGDAGGSGLPSAEAGNQGRGWWVRSGTLKNRAGPRRSGTPQGGAWGRWGEWAHPIGETRSRRDKQEALGLSPRTPSGRWAELGAPTPPTPGLTPPTIVPGATPPPPPRILTA